MESAMNAAKFARCLRPSGRTPAGRMERRLCEGGEIISTPCASATRRCSASSSCACSNAPCARARRTGALRHAACRRGNGPSRHRMVRRGFANRRRPSGQPLSTAAASRLLLADMPGKWQEQFLRPGPWPEEFTNAMREAFCAPARIFNFPK
jgi:hypothetical protein